MKTQPIQLTLDFRSGRAFRPAVQSRIVRLKIRVPNNESDLRSRLAIARRIALGDFNRSVIHSYQD